MNIKQKIIISIVVLSALSAGFYFCQTGSLSLGDSSGTVRVASTSIVAIGPQLVQTIFTSRSTCAARIITTSSETSLKLSFTSGITPTGVVGHLQATSSAVTYPGDTFGCGPISVFGYASGTITITETIQ